MSDILTHTDAGVMTITFNRLDKKNSITAAMYAAMADAVAQAAADPAVRVVVFQGHESIFSAGNDIGDFRLDIIVKVAMAIHQHQAASISILRNSGLGGGRAVPPGKAVASAAKSRASSGTAS